MTEYLKPPIEVDDLISRYQALGKEIEDRLGEVCGALDAQQVERLLREISGHHGSVVKRLKTIDRTPRPEIGDTVDIVRWEYNERGDIHDDYHASGTIAAIDGKVAVVQIPERVMRTPAHSVKAVWHECGGWVDADSDDGWERDVS